MEGHPSVTDGEAMRTLLILLLAASSPIRAADLELPFIVQPRHQAMLVEVQVNGTSACMLIDTGAASTFVSARLAGVHPIRIARARFRPEGGMDVSGLRTRANVTVAGSELELPVVASNLDALSQRYGRRVDGILGQDFLRRFRRVMIDVERGKLVLTE